MRLEDIKVMIHSWDRKRRDISYVKQVLCQGVSFVLNKKELLKVPNKTKLPKPSHIHSYASIHNGVMYFILINNVMDNADRFEELGEEIMDYIFLQPVSDLSISLFFDFVATPTAKTIYDLNSISTKEAIQRILHWSLVKNNWIENKVPTPNGIFQAFVIPVLDIQPKTEVKAFFALYNDLKNDNDPKIELILWDTLSFLVSNSSNQGAFFDVVRPVPPFGVEQRNPNDFYLLQISTINGLA